MSDKLISAERFAARFPVSQDGQIHTLQDRIFSVVHEAIASEPAVVVQSFSNKNDVARAVVHAAEIMEDRYVDGMLDPDSYGVICTELAKIAKAAGI